MPQRLPIADSPDLGRRLRRQAVTRHELLQAGRQLFSEKGLYEARVEDLTRTAGIAKGTLYLYFRDKEHLVEAVVTSGFETLKRQVRARTEGAHSLSEVVSRLVAAHLEFFAANPDLLRIFHQARGMLKFDRPRWRPLRQPLQAHLQVIATQLGQVPSLARLSSQARFELAMQLFGTVSGVSSVRVAMRPGAAVQTSAHDLCRGLSAAFRRAALPEATAVSGAKGRLMRAPRKRQVVPGS
jgi:AcrR family transcriptional regulator